MAVLAKGVSTAVRSVMGLSIMGLSIIGLAGCSNPAAPPVPLPSVSASPASASVPTRPPRLVAADGAKTCVLMDNVVDCWGPLSLHPHHKGIVDWYDSAYYGTWGRIRRRTGPGLELDIAASHICVRNVWGVHCFESSKPISVPNSNGVTHIAMDEHHGCMLSFDGSVRCWGAPPHLPREEQLDRSQRLLMGEQLQPVLLPLPPTAAVAVSFSGTCAVAFDGRVRCLWEPKRPSAQSVVQEPKLPPSRAVALGAGAACAVGQDGKVRCFLEHAREVSPVPGLDDAIDISSSVTNYCARRRGGQVACWSFYGEVFHRGEEPSLPSNVVLDVAAARGAQHVALGMEHMCFIAADQSAQCFGDNTYGQLGRPQRTLHKPPLMQGARRLYRTPEAICVQLDQSFRCLHHQGKIVQLTGTGLRGDIQFPVRYTGDPHYEIAALSSDGKLITTKEPADLEQPTSFWMPLRAEPLAVRDIALPVKARWVGKSQAKVKGFDVVAGEDGSWWYRKDGSFQQLKHFAPIQQLVPHQQSASHLCYLLRDRTLRCEAERSDEWEALDKAKVDPNRPVLFDDVEAVSESCVLRRGTLRCWESGMGYRRAPTLIAGMPTTVRSFSGNFTQGCALVEAGDVYCWFGDEPIKRIEGLPEKIEEVAFTRYFACARSAAGEVACWGPAPAVHLRYGPGPIRVGGDTPNRPLDEVMAVPTARALERRAM